MTISGDDALLRDETVLVLTDGWTSLMTGVARSSFEKEVLPRFLAGRSWIPGRNGAGGLKVSLGPSVPFAIGGPGSVLLAPVLLAQVWVERPGDDRQLYFLPIAVSLTEPGSREEQRLAPFALTRVTWAGRSGLLYDALADDRVVSELVAAMGRAEKCPGLAFHHTSAYARLAVDAARQPVRRPAVERSNTTLRLGDRAVLKAYRKVTPGPHPELEVGRFLTEVAGYANTPPLLGALEYVAENGCRTVLCLLHAYVPNQGDAWSCAINHLTGTTSDDPERFRHVALMRRLGQRTGEFHRALSIATDDPAFAAEPVSEDELYVWQESMRDAASTVMRDLRRARADLPDAARVRAVLLLRRERDLMERISALVPDHLDPVKTRCHGDLHLGQVLVVGSDTYIAGFEGEPMRPLSFRRAKHSPLRDVAGVLRSIDYAVAVVRHSHRSGTGQRVSEGRLGQWQLAAGAAFLGGWCDMVSGCPSVPTDTRVTESLLDLFLLEKTLYEVAHEMVHRPDLLAIPLAGLQSLLGDRP
ncbi:MAG: putative maltokinase [Alphaproteobacteria bacterium]